jgi:hypothetical protein
MKLKWIVLALLCAIALPTSAEATGLADIASPRFRVEPEFFTCTQNPAALGFIEQDSVYFWTVTDMTPAGKLDAGGNQSVNGYRVGDSFRPMRVGYVMPLGRLLGLGVEFFDGSYKKFLSTPFLFDNQGIPTNDIGGTPNHNGGGVSLGYRFVTDMSLGVSLLAWYTKGQTGVPWDYMVDAGFNYAVEGAYMLRAWDDQLSFDLSATYVSQGERYVDFSQNRVAEGSLPFIVEASVNAALLGSTLLLSLKGISDIYVDQRGGYVLRAIPMAEYWPIRFLALRAGFEYSHMDQIGKFAVGYGFLGGLSLKIWRIELDGNFTIREKPIRLLPGSTLSDWKLVIGASFNPGLLTR